MFELPLKTFYYQSQIACRYLRSPSLTEPLIITIPGGPSLSGKYIDHFLINLAAHLKMNVGILDLPNHGDSVVSAARFPLSYQDCIEMIKETLLEISEHCDQLILFGQSFGARLVFDLLASSDIKIDAAFLTGFPYKFEMSEHMQKKISQLDTGLEQNDMSSDERYIQAWKKILPIYTHSPLSDDVFEALSTNMSISGNENMLNVVPPIEDSAQILSNKSVIPHITILQGDADGVVPDNNLTRLQSIIPSAHFYEIKNCGHFPMVEKPEDTVRAFLQLIALIRG